MVKVNCAFCNKELDRRPCRVKTNKFFYCNASHQMKHCYETGLRDKYKITKKANQTLRDRTQKRYDEGTCNIKIGKRGYKLIYLPIIGWKKYHHYIWEKHNKTKIPKGFHIHHIDGDKLNNKIENLQIISAVEHSKLHIKRNLKTGQFY